MCNSLKLYADNLICMDLCCCSSTEAMELLGPEVSRHNDKIQHTMYNVYNVCVSVVSLYILSYKLSLCPSLSPSLSVCLCCSADAASLAEEEGCEGDLGLQAHGGGQTR